VNEFGYEADDLSKSRDFAIFEVAFIAENAIVWKSGGGAEDHPA
jgi:hypothetical protein